jgi:hypothetical protein
MVMLVSVPGTTCWPMTPSPARPMLPVLLRPGFWPCGALGAMCSCRLLGPSRHSALTCVSARPAHHCTALHARLSNSKQEAQPTHILPAPSNKSWLGFFGRHGASSPPRSCCSTLSLSLRSSLDQPGRGTKKHSFQVHRLNHSATVAPLSQRAGFEPTRENPMDDSRISTCAE